MRTLVLSVLALLAFAGNSLLCRLALAERTIDAVSFSAIRLGSGAAMLLLLVGLRARGRRAPSGSFRSGALLFSYALPFSLAYLSLPAGTGALLLFGAVQVTMIASALRSGERPHPLQWLGLGLALGGLAYLLWPGIAAPAPLAALSMIAAGIAWGGYTLSGRGARDPLAETAGNFARSVPLALLACAGFAVIGRPQVSVQGSLLAMTSGAVTSGIGYALWYAALPSLSAVRAATVQLSVPVITALLGVLWLDERLSLRLALASVLILGGVALTLIARERRAKSA